MDLAELVNKYKIEKENISDPNDDKVLEIQESDVSDNEIPDQEKFEALKKSRKNLQIAEQMKNQGLLNVNSEKDDRKGEKIEKKETIGIKKDLNE